MGNLRLTSFHAIEGCLQNPGGALKPLTLYYPSSEGAPRRALALVDLARQRGVAVRSVSPEELARLGGASGPRGGGGSNQAGRLRLVLEARRVEGGGGASRVYEDLKNAPRGLVLVLDGITDPHNLGAILRSADKFEVDLVITAARGSAGLSETVAKVSAGASAWTPLLEAVNLVKTLQDLQSTGYWVYGARMDGRAAWETDFADKAVLVLGSEGKGMRRLVEETCDHLVAVPGGGHVDSFNVSVAAALLLYEIRRPR
ncbi:MAG: 23S rRNA (guanosine(2251)-2'-O)-methyltransferase RlmB [Spirochaetales bacterium]|jgi:23S rRNA (guanosine2251-2'-O)-methyltransferase|nr:23S rRNA (guanosine(2251)-2'-O)-methyltransferase RlmB [Spirochaetales bacterium]